MAIPERHLLAVYPDMDTAQAAADAARSAGLPDSAVRVAAHDDEVRALRAEMREEMSDTWVGAGNVGPFTKEMSKGFAVASVVGAIAGALLGILAALALMDDVGTGMRILVGGAIGAVCGGTVGFVAGGSLGARGPAERLAAERGVTVTVASFDSAVEAALRRFNPIRMDVLDAEGHPVSTVAAEHDDSAREVAGGIARTLGHEEEGDWSPERNGTQPRRR